MRTLLHLTSVLLMLPGLVLAAAFLMLGHAIAAQSLPGFLGALLELFLWLIPWGLLGTAAALLLLLGAGCMPRYRWLAAACVALLAIASAAVVVALTARHAAFNADQLPFFVPGILAAAIGIWLAAREWPRRGGAQSRPDA